MQRVKIGVIGAGGVAQVEHIPNLLTLKHKDFRQPVQIMLKTDDAGRTILGELADIVSITVPTRMSIAIECHW